MEEEKKSSSAKVAYVKKPRSGLRVGLAAGHKVTLHVSTKGPGTRRGVKSKRVAVVRETIRDVCGLAPYEKRILDVIKVRGHGQLGRASACGAAVEGRHAAGQAPSPPPSPRLVTLQCAHLSPPLHVLFLPPPPPPSLQSGTDNSEKKSYKLAKQRLGTHKRALRKRAEMQDYLATYNKAMASRAAAAAN